ncbi:MAG TPA: saccharopine dehydrogenase [Bacteroidales bacterium]|nr:saccharopine dehydrogenase [Bacteroidales bacterium]
MAVAAFDAGVSYFDLTEDTDTAEKIRTLNGINKARFYPQCGLAPGAVGIIANYLSTFFEEIYEIKLRVGALPITATNHIQYYLSWSPEGLVNEYYRLCPAIIDGISVLAEPLDGYEFLTLDGIGYEAFNTSGGAGDLISKLKHKNIKKLTYKTIRYPGHRDQILFLKEDLRLSKEEMIELLSKQLPHNHDDVVIIFVEVIGKQNGQLRRETYFKKIYGDRDLGISAIQKTTAAGVVSMVDCYLNEKIKKDEIVRYEDFVSNKYGLMYEF